MERHGFFRRWDAIDPVLYETSDHIAFVTLHRPEAGNRLTPSGVAGLRAAWERFADDDAVDIAILTGIGGHFCAGADASVGAAVAAQRRARKPVIAAINGRTAGRGLELALACRTRIASADASFGSLDWKHGVCANPRARELARVVGMGPLKQLALGREPRDAGWAARHGIVHDVVAGADLIAAAEHLADRATRAHFAA